MERPDDSARAVRPGLVLAGVLLVAVLVYARVIEGGFVWDDHMLIDGADRVGELRGLSDYLGQGFWSDYAYADRLHAFYRPVVTLSFTLDAWLHGDNPAGFHLTNLLLHLVVTTQVFLRARATGAGGAAAGAVSLFFALAPRLSESVAWVSGRTDLMATALALFAFHLAAPAPPRRADATWRHAACAAALLLALLAKEVAIAALVAIAAHALTLPRVTRVRRVLAVGSAAAVYLALRRTALQGLVGETHTFDSTQSHLLAVLEAWGRYAFMLLDPFHPRSQIGLLDHPDARYVGLGVVTLVALVGFAVRFRARLLDPPSIAWTAWPLVVVPIALVAHVVPLPMRVVAADRFLYLPLAAIAILAAPPLHRWLQGTSRARVVAALLPVAALAGIPTTMERVTLWGDEIAFWGDAVETTTADNPLPTSQLGTLYMAAAMYPEARQALVARTVTEIGMRNLAVTLRRLGRCDESREVWRGVLATHAFVAAPDYALAARSSLCAGALDEADAILERGERAHPGAPALAAARDDVAYLATAPALAPPDDDPELLERWAERSSRAGRDRDTAAFFTRLATSPRATVPQVEGAAQYLLRFGSLDQATVAVGRAVARQSVHADALGALLAVRQRRHERLAALLPLLSPS